MKQNLKEIILHLGERELYVRKVKEEADEKRKMSWKMKHDGIHGTSKELINS